MIIKIAKYFSKDLLNTRALWLFYGLLMLLSWAVLGLEGNPNKGAASLLSLFITLLPLFIFVFTLNYLHRSSRFIQLLLCQPISRQAVWMGISIALFFTTNIFYILAFCVPMLFFGSMDVAFSFLFAGVMLNGVCIAFSLLIFNITQDKIKSIGMAIGLWMFFTMIYDAILLMLMFQFSDYPIDKPLVVATIFNPIDVARIWILLEIDSAALMGFTGALFKSFFGGEWGIATCVMALILWVFIPFWGSLKRFTTKDF